MIATLALAAAFTVTGPEKPQPWEKTAAQELTEYLSRRLGNNPISVDGKKAPVFRVADDAALAEDEWSIRSEGGEVRLAGGGTHGTLYAVYHFLEDCCGVRWWSETEEDVPAASALKLPALAAKGKPAFDFRDVFRSTDAEESQSRFAIRRRLNRNGDVPVPLTIGGSIEYGSPYHCHTFDRYVPWKKLGKEHPEWFSLAGGRRWGGGGYNDGGQLCFSNPELVDYLEKKVLESVDSSAAAAKRKGLKAPVLFEVSMNDNKKYCECEKCRAEYELRGISGQYLRVVNRIADAVKAKCPGGMISMLAYYFTEDPPKDGTRARDNVIVKLCNTRANMAESILTGEDNAIMRDLVKTWSKLAKNLYIWDYDTTYTKDSRGYPFPSEFYLADKYRFFREHNVTGIFWEQEEQSETDLFDIKFYLKSKLFEDPYADSEALVDSAFREYYGEVPGRFVLAARRIMRDARVRNHGVLYWFPQRNQWNWLRSDDIAAMRECFAAAEKAAGGDERLLRRLRRTRAGFDRLSEWRDGAFRKTAEGYVLQAPKFALYGKEKTALVDDAAAPEGKAVELKAGEKGLGFPLLLAYYDANKKLKKGVLSTRLKYDGGIDGEYRWYEAGHTMMSDNGYFYFGDSWLVQAHQIIPDFGGGDYRVRVLLARTASGAIRLAEMRLE